MAQRIFQRSMGNKNSAFETKLKAKAGDFFCFFLGGGWEKTLFAIDFCGEAIRFGFSLESVIYRYIYIHCFVGFRGGRGLWIYIYIYNMFLWLHNCIP